MVIEMKPKTRLWTVCGNVWPFPLEWSQEEVVLWINTPFRVCPACGKIDAPRWHFKDCDPAAEAYRQEQIDHFYK